MDEIRKKKKKKKMVTNQHTSQCILQYHEYGTPKKVQIKFREKYGRNTKAPDVKTIKSWSKKFKESGSCHRKSRKRSPTVHREAVVKKFEENPPTVNQESCNLFRNKLLKDAGYKVYRPQVVQMLNPDDYSARVAFAEWALEKINDSLRFVKFLLFSDEAVFHLEGSINRKSSRYWASENPHWTIEKSLNTPKNLVWAAIGHPGIIGPFFFDGNVTADLYLQMITAKIYPAFRRLNYSSEIVFMQDGAPPH